MGGKVLEIRYLDPAALRSNPHNERVHDRDQIEQIKASISELGFNDPIAVDAEGVIIEGHGRVEAAISLGLGAVPVIELGHLTPEQADAYRIAHNKLPLNARWDAAKLLDTIEALQATDLPVALLGFSDADLARMADDQAAAQMGAAAGDGADPEAAPREDGQRRHGRGDDYDYVPFNVIVAKQERDRIYAVLQKVKQQHFISKTDQALLVVINEWDANHG